jgi:phytoene synthase
VSNSAALVLRADDRVACREWIRRHSKSFFLSSLLLPSQVRQAAWALYAFCRRADDAVDDGAASPMRRVEGLRARLSAVYRGAAVDDPIDRAFGEVVRRYRIPQPLPAALLDGMEMDARGTTYDSDEALELYCFRVAATVGLMMTRVMGVRRDDAYLRAADLGIAMQLTNIARDVGEDARRGRVYLPTALLQQQGVDREVLLRAPEISDGLREAVRRVLERAEAHYRAATQGIPLLPRGCRLAIASSRFIYAAIGDSVARAGYDSVTRRAYVPLGKKLLLVARAATAVVLPASPPISGPADARLRERLFEVGLA